MNKNQTFRTVCKVKVKFVQPHFQIYSNFCTVFFAGPTVIFGAKTKQQFFVVKPQDSEVGQGGSVVLPCEVGDRRGRVQWTKDGLTLGKKPTFLVKSANSDFHLFVRIAQSVNFLLHLLGV